MEINEVGGSSMENAFSSIRIWPTSEYEIQHCKHEAANGQLPPNLKTLIIADFNDWFRKYTTELFFFRMNHFQNREMTPSSIYTC